MKNIVQSALLIYFLMTAALACTCGGIPSPYQAYREAQAVFVGEVISSQDIPYDQTLQDSKYDAYAETH